MFEKEAEEYLKTDGTKAEQILNMLNEISPLKITSTQATFIIAMIKQVYQDGAEFGYNKANEWHYVKDGDLPKDEDWKWCVSYRGYCYVAKYEEMFGCHVYFEKGTQQISKNKDGEYSLVTTASIVPSDHYDYDSEAICVPTISSKGHGVAELKRIFYANGKFCCGDILMVMLLRCRYLSVTDAQRA